jgi:hypothetical protein
MMDTKQVNDASDSNMEVHDSRVGDLVVANTLRNEHGADMSLTTEETKRLRRFQDRVQELKDRNFFDGEQITLRHELKFDIPNKKGETNFSGFNDDAFRAGIQILRQFTLDRDEVHFLSICKIIRRKCNRPDLVAWCNHAKQRWQDKFESTRPVGLKLGEKEFTLGDCLKLLFYGSMSHTLKENANAWDSLSPMMQHAIFFNVQSGMFTLIRCLSVVDSVIMYWLDEPDAQVPTLEGLNDSPRDDSEGKGEK